jgi:hypothetical protein
VLRWTVVAAAVFIVLLAGCSSQPGVTVSAVCHPDTDPSMDITKPTIFADLTLSSRIENVPRVRIVMLDAAGHEIGNTEDVAGYVFPGDTKVLRVPVGIPKGGVKAFRSCTASVVGFGANPAR